MNLSADFVAQALKLPSPEARMFSDVTTDSRTIQPQSLFVALQGEHFDGHQFIEEALKKGAIGIICKKGTHQNSQISRIFFEVEDPLHAYRLLAQAWRSQFKIPVYAIAGSVGKTTTKEFATALLSTKYENVLKTANSENGFVGIPKTLLKLRTFHEAAVIEIGIDEKGAMEQHLDLVRPQAGVITSISPEHLDQLENLETVAQEELKLFDWLQKNNSKIIQSLDDPKIANFSPKDPKSVFTYSSLNKNADLVAQLNMDSLKVNNETYPLPVVGVHNATNLLTSLALLNSENLSSEQIHQGLKTFQGPKGRNEVLKTKKGTSVLLDYYNASPASMEAAFNLLSHLSSDKGRRFLCLGDMLELGEKKKAFHRELASSIIQHRFEFVLLFGELMEELKEELHKKGFSGRVDHFSFKEDLVQAIVSQAQKEDWILIKGSRGMKMEEVWEKIQ